LESWLYSNL